MKAILKNKIANFDDELLMEALNSHDVENWRQWGNNELRIMAEEAHKRGLIK